jgi:hypothetical protein
MAEPVEQINLSDLVGLTVLMPEPTQLLALRPIIAKIQASAMSGDAEQIKTAIEQLEAIPSLKNTLAATRPALISGQAIATLCSAVLLAWGQSAVLEGHQGSDRSHGSTAKERNLTPQEANAFDIINSF